MGPQGLGSGSITIMASYLHRHMLAVKKDSVLSLEAFGGQVMCSLGLLQFGDFRGL